MNNQIPWDVPIVVVAAVILQHDDKILLTRRKRDVHQGGLWEFPGGKQEVGETLEQCLRRELKEEIDIEVGDLKPFSTVHHRYREKEVELHFFSCSTYKGNPKPLECLEMAWVSMPDLCSYEFPPADQPVLQKILQGQLSREPGFEYVNSALPT